jgi:hypothetical protein
MKDERRMRRAKIILVFMSGICIRFVKTLVGDIPPRGGSKRPFPRGLRWSTAILAVWPAGILPAVPRETTGKMRKMPVCRTAKMAVLRSASERTFFIRGEAGQKSEIRSGFQRFNDSRFTI